MGKQRKLHIKKICDDDDHVDEDRRACQSQWSKRFVHSREVEFHLIEMFDCVVIRFDPQVSHLAQPEVHSLSSPVSIFMEEANCIH